MGKYIQDDRPLCVETPLGKDKLLLLGFQGQEKMSGLFHFDLDLMSEEATIKPADIVGKSVDFFVRFEDGEPRYFNGIVNRFMYMGMGDRGHLYQAEVVPWLWMLTKGSDCKVYSVDAKKNAVEIIDDLLGGLGFTDYKWDVQRTPEKREFCVQYRETHFDFMNRILEEEGIFYYFTHSQGKHELVFTDHINGVFDCKDAEARLVSNLSKPEFTDNLTDWHHAYEYTSGKFAHADFDFENPGSPVQLTKSSLVSLQDNSKLEYYDYPNTFVKKGLGDALAKLRMEEEECRHNTVNGSSECRSFSPGARFTLAKHHNEAESGGKWVLTSVQHTANLGGHYISGAGGPDQIYGNSFQCIPADIVFRPPYKPRPGIHGIQTAEVVGPGGEEIYTDEHGRVKVQFHWDRLGKKDENSSSWFRVSQIHAGQGWGVMDLPRIGEEVIISFLEGNPDRPIIIGRVYNGSNTPPFALPGEKARRGNTTKTHKGSGYNELSMDDTAGAEQLRVNAQFNMDTNVNNNQTLNVGVDRTNTIGSNESITIGANQTVSIGANQEVTIDGDQTVSVSGNRTDSVGGDETLEVSGNQTETIGSNQDLSIGADQIVSVKSNINIDAGTKIVVEAGASIELIVGGNGIKIDASGVTINGVAIKIEGTATTTMKAPATTINGDATLTLMGAMTKIN